MALCPTTALDRLKGGSKHGQSSIDDEHLDKPIMELPWGRISNTLRRFLN